LALTPFAFSDELEITHFPKAAVMQRAAIAVDANQIAYDPLRQVMLAMRQGIANS
jgi:hypothetical protein